MIWLVAFVVAAALGWWLAGRAIERDRHREYERYGLIFGPKNTIEH